MKGTLLCFLVSIGFVAGAGIANAEASAQFAAPAYRAPDDANVNGFRFSIFHGQNDRMRGFDLGLFSLSQSGNFSGGAYIFGIHRLTGDMDGGAAISFLNLHEGRDEGFNGAFVNKLNDAERAVDVAFVNIADGTTFVDVGGLNVADASRVQVGFVNVVNELKGVQIGFINVARNGFFPVFPFFNFPKK